MAEPIQSRVGRRLIDAGAALVAGSHPHWVQGVEPYAGGMIAHSLGNFVFDMDFMQQTREGVTLTATFWGDELKGVRFTPYVIGPDFAPRRATGSGGSEHPGGCLAPQRPTVPGSLRLSAGRFNGARARTGPACRFAATDAWSTTPGTSSALW